MIVLRCTQRVLRGSGITPAPDPSPPTAALGEWYANALSLPFRGRSLVLFTESQTLLTVLAPGRVLRTTVPLFQERAPALLRRLRIPEPWTSKQQENMQEISFARTASRSILGFMNDIGQHIWFAAEATHSFEELDLDALEVSLAGVLHRVSGDYHRPVDLLGDLIGGDQWKVKVGFPAASTNESAAGQEGLSKAPREVRSCAPAPRA